MAARVMTVAAGALLAAAGALGGVFGATTVLVTATVTGAAVVAAAAAAAVVTATTVASALGTFVDDHVERSKGALELGVGIAGPVALAPLMPPTVGVLAAIAIDGVYRLAADLWRGRIDEMPALPVLGRSPDGLGMAARGRHGVMDLGDGIRRIGWPRCLG